MSFEVLYTSNFERELKRLSKKYASLKTDLRSLISSLEENPFLGTAIGKNCYKIRMAIASTGKGKSGGARIISHLHIAENLCSFYQFMTNRTATRSQIRRFRPFSNSYNRSTGK